MNAPSVKCSNHSHGVTTTPALLAEIERQADDRAHLAEVLLESLRAPSLSEIETEWEQEIERRVAAFDKGELSVYPAEEVFAEARRLAR